MKALIAALALLVVAGVAFFLYQSPAGPPAEITGVEASQELSPLFQAYNAGMVGGDAEAVIALYTSDAVEMVPGDVRTLDDIVVHYTEAIEAGNFLAFDFSPLDAWVQGDAAFILNEVDISYEVEDMGVSTFPYYSFMRLVREDGAWKIQRNVAGPRDAPPEG
jgi:ketosteroid isomerase-like protein